MASLVRLFVDHPLGAGQRVALTREQAHYLFGVMRLSVQGELRLFNGSDGEWSAHVVEAGKRAGTLMCAEQTAPQTTPPDVMLCFAPIKKTRTDFIVEKAVELGVRTLQPILTDYTNSERVRVDRLQAHALEAAEQCGATYMPTVLPPAKLSKLLQDWDAARQIQFCDEETTRSPQREDARPGGSSGAWAIFVGPEGGFSPAERARLTDMPCAQTIQLGPRILRADTAALAALTLWQRRYGDWQ